jgi:hypothetical protein
MLNNVAPLKPKTIHIRPNTAWYTSELCKAKVIRRRLERKWLKSHLESDYQKSEISVH